MSNKDKKDNRIGNQFWKARAKHGRDLIFKTPEALWESCVEYFEWVDANPLYASELVKFQGKAKAIQVEKMRAMTISGLCLFLDVDQTTWGEYRKKKDYSRVTTQAEEIIYNQKFTGASADLLNANIIARDLGLADKKELSGKNGNPIETKTTVQAPEVVEALKDLLGKL